MEDNGGKRKCLNVREVKFECKKLRDECSQFCWQRDMKASGNSEKVQKGTVDQ